MIHSVLIVTYLLTYLDYYDLSIYDISRPRSRDLDPALAEGCRSRKGRERRMAFPSPPRRGQSQGASSVASNVGDDRDAWSCPLPNEIFEVGSQGQDEDIAALGVAIALLNHHAWCTPVRHASQTLDSPSTFLAALTFLRCLLGRDGSLPSSTRRSCRSQGSGHLFLRSHSPIRTVSLINLHRG